MNTLFEITQKRIEIYNEMLGVEMVYKRLMTTFAGNVPVLSAILDDVVSVQLELQAKRKALDARQEELTQKVGVR